MRQRSLSIWVAAVALLVAVSAASVVTLDSIGQGRHSLNSRFDARADVTVSFLDAYVQDLFAREQGEAETHLMGPAPTASDLADVSHGQRMQAAVLLDSTGKALAVFPDKPELVGTDLTTKYAHLAAAVDGQSTVSSVVASAAEGIPVVGFARPFDTPYGRRVVSGALDVRDTPITSFLINATPTPDQASYVVDANDVVVASTSGATGPLVDLEPELAAAAGKADSGALIRQGAEQRYVVRAVSGTPWRLLVRIPSAQLYRPLTPIRRSTLLVLALLAAVTVLVLAMLAQAYRRTRAATVNAGTDALTGAANRRALDEWLEATAEDTRVAVLLVDLDHFKTVNDTRGHLVGDEVLRTVANRLDRAVQLDDRVVRWGGEEFAVVVLTSSPAVAGSVADRIHRAVGEPVAVSDGVPITITTSIGVALGTVATFDTVLAEADTALYRAKDSGRNQVVLVQPALT